MKLILERVSFNKAITRRATTAMLKFYFVSL